MKKRIMRKSSFGGCRVTFDVEFNVPRDSLLLVEEGLQMNQSNLTLFFFCGVKES